MGPLPICISIGPTQLILPWNEPANSQKDEHPFPGESDMRYSIHGTSVDTGMLPFLLTAHLQMGANPSPILRSEDIEFVVAPYEADAQLAYLATLTEEQGGIAAVITEDSDLMAYGCQAVIFKMDKYGNGEEILLDMVFTSVLDGLSFRYFDQELFTVNKVNTLSLEVVSHGTRGPLVAAADMCYVFKEGSILMPCWCMPSAHFIIVKKVTCYCPEGMCILAGCDFLPSVPGIGIKRAYALVSKYRNLDRILSVLKHEKGRLMPEDYSLSFKEALAVFRHARIYDADAQMLKPMKPVPLELQQSFDSNLDFLGPVELRELPPSVAAAIAQGKVDPITLEAYDCFFKVECRYNHLRVGTSDKLPRTLTQWAPIQPSCFTIFSANENKKDIIAVHEIYELIAWKVTEEKPVMDNTKYMNEATALKKLMSLHEHVCTSETAEVERVKFPNNNPFNKNKNKDGYSDLNSCPVKQDSVVVDIEETNAQTVDSQESFNTESSDCLPGAVTQMLPIQQSCPNDFQDSEAIEMNIRVTEQKPTMDDMKFTNAAIALKKIMSLREHVCESETMEVERVELPNNNPFNKKKWKDDYSNLIECPIEQDAVVFDVDDAIAQTVNSQDSFNTESSDCLPGAAVQVLSIQQSCPTDSQDSETSEMNIQGKVIFLKIFCNNDGYILVISVQSFASILCTYLLDVCVAVKSAEDGHRIAKEPQVNVDARNNSNEGEKQIKSTRCCHELGMTKEETIDFPSNRTLNKRKQDDNILDMDASPVEQVSVVIDVDELDVMCITTPESQESVKSKPRKRAEASNMKNEKNQKSANRSSESGNMSIFKFFKRLKS
ncbi:hypothetical protein ACLOJK_009474 [Asimina triloba]